MIFDILEDKLIPLGLLAGESVYRNALPGDVSVGVMMRQSFEGLKVDPNIPDYYKGAIQVITRHTDPGAGSKLAFDVAEKLKMTAARTHHPQTQNRGAVTLLQFVPRTLPIDYPRLTGNGFEWSQTWDAVFVLKPMA